MDGWLLSVILYFVCIFNLIYKTCHIIKLSICLYSHISVVPFWYFYSALYTVKRWCWQLFFLLCTWVCSAAPDWNVRTWWRSSLLALVLLRHVHTGQHSCSPTVHLFCPFFTLFIYFTLNSDLQRLLSRSQSCYTAWFITSLQLLNIQYLHPPWYLSTLIRITQTKNEITTAAELSGNRVTRCFCCSCSSGAPHRPVPSRLRRWLASFADGRRRRGEGFTDISTAAHYSIE